MKLSIIVPVLNEASTLPALLPALTLLLDSGAEVLLVDGGSHDHTDTIAEQAGWRVIRSARGRACQMNAGVLHASGDVLLFLHADTTLPANAHQVVIEAVQGGHCWGRFDVVIAGRPAMLKVVGWLMNLRSRWTGIATGDQAMFVRRDAFEHAGRFPEQPLMEDIELSKRLKRFSAPACLRGPVTTSGRRWEAYGVWRTIWLMWRLRWAYWRGQSAADLARAYR